MQVPMESREATFVVEEGEELPNSTFSVPSGFDLTISPNPFQDNTQIKFSLDKNYDDFDVSIYSLDGKLHYQQVENRGAGDHVIEISADRLPNAGIYFVQIVSEGLFTSHKLILANY